MFFVLITKLKCKHIKFIMKIFISSTFAISTFTTSAISMLHHFINTYRATVLLLQYYGKSSSRNLFYLFDCLFVAFNISGPIATVLSCSRVFMTIFLTMLPHLECHTSSTTQYPTIKQKRGRATFLTFI